MKPSQRQQKKINRRVFRSIAKTSLEEEAYNLLLPHQPTSLTQEQQKKQRKAREAKERRERAIAMPTPEEENRLHQKKGPVFDHGSHRKPQKTRSRKKTPRL